MKFVILISILFFSHSVLGAEKARILMVKGDATKLTPGSVEASKVKKGEMIPEDTSIVTKKRSFVRVKFNDKSTMNIGPESKVVVTKMPPKKANMVNLLKGMIKAEVQKESEKQSKTKMLIKTDTAIMGVRGTKFQTTFNPVNKTTSLVTVEGNVAMAKIEEKTSEVVTEKVIEGKTYKVAEVEQVEISDVEEAEKALEQSSEVVEVKAGRYSGVAQKATKPTVPVKIAPKQYDALAKSLNSNNKAKDVMKEVATDPAPEGFMDKTSGTLAPKAGGYVDFSTGIYVPPTSDSKLDKATGTYEAKVVIGNVDKSGEYIPPKGVKVDAKKGLVIDEKEIAKIASADEKAAITAAVSDINKEVEKQIVVNKVSTKKKTNWSRYLPDNHLLSAKLMPMSEALTVENKSSDTSADFYTESANWTLFTWKQVWNKKWSTFLTMGGVEYKIEESDDFNLRDFSEDDEYFSMGLEYNWNKKWTALFSLTDRSEYYVRPFGGEDVELSDRGLSTTDLGARYKGNDWRGISLAYFGLLHLSDSKAPGQTGHDIDSEYFSFTLGLDGKYKFSDTMHLDGSLLMRKSEMSNDDFTYERLTFGSSIEFIYIL
mgnify:CR=1 FL=1